MSKFLFIFLLLPLFILDWLGEKSIFNRIGSVNKYVALGNYYHTIGNKPQALRCYSFIYDTLRYEDEPIMLNYAQLLLSNGNKKRAEFMLNRLLKISSNASIRSDALLNLGILYRNNAKVCLSFFRRSLVENPSNDIARFNYELMLGLSVDGASVSSQRKFLANKSSSPKGASKSPVQNRAAGGDGPLADGFKEQGAESKQIEAMKNKSRADNDGFKPKSDADVPLKNVINRDNLRDLNLSQEQALQILDAMQLEEVQYLQQLRKRVTVAAPAGPKW